MLCSVVKGRMLLVVAACTAGHSVVVGSVIVGSVVVGSG